MSEEKMRFKVAYRKYPRVQFETSGETLVEQHHKDSCNVNNVLARYMRVHGRDMMSDFRGFVGGQFGDFTQVGSFKEILDQADRAVEAFAMLPAKIRSRFQNDPLAMVEFLQDSKNVDEAIDLGLMERKHPQSASKEAALAVKKKVENGKQESGHGDLD